MDEASAPASAPKAWQWAVPTLFLVAVLYFWRAKGFGDVNTWSRDFGPMAEDIRSGKGIQTAFYPPLQGWLLAQWRNLGGSEHGLGFVQAGMVTGTAAILFAAAHRLTASVKVAAVAVLLAMMKPDFLHATIGGRDAATEALLLALAFWLVVRLQDETRRKSALLLGAELGVVLVLGGLARVSGFVIGLGFVLFLIVRLRDSGRLGATLALGVLILGLGWHMAANQARVGKMVLATNSGVNLYFGNHPLYALGHPLYDIDVFLGKLATKDVPPGQGEVAESDAYSALAKGFIKKDPKGFLERAILKSEWVWLNFEPVPARTVETVDGRDYAVDPETMQLPPIESAGGDFPSTLYRLIYTPLAIGGLIALFWRRLDRRLWVATAPMFALWPVLAITFPDTRFKVGAEMVFAVVAAAFLARVRRSVVRSLGR